MSCAHINSSIAKMKRRCDAMPCHAYPNPIELLIKITENYKS